MNSGTASRICSRSTYPSVNHCFLARRISMCPSSPIRTLFPRGILGLRVLPALNPGGLLVSIFIATKEYPVFPHHSRCFRVVSVAFPQQDWDVTSSAASFPEHLRSNDLFQRPLLAVPRGPYGHPEQSAYLSARPNGERRPKRPESIPQDNPQQPELQNCTSWASTNTCHSSDRTVHIGPGPFPVAKSVGQE